MNKNIGLLLIALMSASALNGMEPQRLDIESQENVTPETLSVSLVIQGISLTRAQAIDAYHNVFCVIGYLREPRVYFYLCPSLRGLGDAETRREACIRPHYDNLFALFPSIMSCDRMKDIRIYELLKTALDEALGVDDRDLFDRMR